MMLKNKLKHISQIILALARVLDVVIARVCRKFYYKAKPKIRRGLLIAFLCLRRLVRVLAGLISKIPVDLSGKIKYSPIILIAIVFASGIIFTWYVGALRATYGSYSFPSPAYAKTHGGLVSHWKMDESAADSCSGGSNDSCDYVGGNDGAWQANATNVAGKFGNAVEFDGTDDFIDTSDSASFDFESGFTLCAWAEPDVVDADTRLIYRYDAVSGDGYYIGQDSISPNTGEWSFLVFVGGSSAIISSDLPSILEWQHVCGVRDDDGDMFIYINGAKQRETGNMPGAIDSNDGVRMGVDIFSFNDYDGKIDDVKIWNRALSADEVIRQYKEGPGPVGWWKFDDYSGNTTTTDSSGYGNNATTSAGMDGDNWVPGKIGRAFRFDGVNEYVGAGDWSQGLTSGYTLSAWIKTKIIPAGAGQIITRDDSAIPVPKRYYQFRVDTDGTVRFVRFDSSNNVVSNFNTTKVVNDNTWHHVLATFDNGVGSKIFIDGNVYGTDAVLTNNRDDTGEETYIGWRGGDGTVEPVNDEHFNGLIDDVQIYNYALTPFQIAQNFNGGAPVAQYSFDENNASSTYNTAEHLHNASTTGTLTGEGWRTGGKVKNALLFDGVDDNVSVPADSLIDLNDKDEYSVSAWIKPNSAGESDRGVIFQKGSTIFRIQDEDSASSTHLYANIDLATTDAVASSSNTVKAGDWSHVVMTYASTSDVRKIKFYIDGKASSKLVDTAGKGDPTDDSGSILYIGGNNGAATFDGMIDEFKIYLYELTPSDVRRDYNASKGVVLGKSNRGYERSDGLVSHWKMDELIGTWNGTADEVVDSVGTNHGVRANNASTTAGHFGYAGKFDDDDYVSVSDNASLDFGTEDFSISLWAKLETDAGTGYDLILDKRTPTEGYRYVVNPGGSISLLLYSPDGNQIGQSSPSGYNDNIWHHFVYSVDADSTTGLRFFVDGVEDGAGADMTGVGDLSSTANLVIGCSNALAQCLPGLIDDVKIWNRALGEDEVVRQYREGPGPVSWWKLDERSGLTAKDSVNDNDGVLTNMEGNSNDWQPGKINGAIRFDTGGAVEENVSFTANCDAELRTPSFSYDLWIKPERFGTQIFIWRNAGTGWWRSYILAAGTIHYDAHDGVGEVGNMTSNEILKMRKWNHVAYAYDDTKRELQVYLNGVFQDWADSIDIYNDTSCDIYTIGATNATWPTDALMDDVKHYDYALNPRQVAMLFDGGKPSSHWKLDEGEGSVIHDSMEMQENHGTLTIGASGVQDSIEDAWVRGRGGKFGQALAFDGVDDAIDIPDDPAIESGDGYIEKSVTAWFKVVDKTVSADKQVIYKSGSVTTGLAVYVYNSLLYVGGWNNVAAENNWTGTYLSTDKIESGEWHHVSLILETTTTTALVSNGFRGYFDGKLFGMGDGGAVWADTGDINIGYTDASLLHDGSSGSGHYFEGLLSDVRHYNYALTHEDVRNVYNENKGIVLGTSENRGYGASDGLVSHWKMDEASWAGAANEVVDSVGGNHGVAVGGVLTAAGKFGNAGDFIGDNDYVQITDNSSLDITNSITLAAWIKSDAAQGQYDKVIAKLKDTQYPYQLDFEGSSDDRIYFSLSDGPSAHVVISNADVPIGIWTHVMGTYDGVEMKLYINGLEEDSLAGSFLIEENDQDLFIGGRTSMYYFDGKVDDVKIWNRALSSDEVVRQYVEGPGPVGHWDFDNATTSGLVDMSGNGYDGAFAGGLDLDAKQPGILGRGFKFDGGSESVTIPDAADLTPGAGDYAVSFWVKVPFNGSATYEGIVVKGVNSTAPANTWGVLRRSDLTNKVNFVQATDGGGAWTASLISSELSNGWHYIVGKREGSTAQLYVDGVYESEDTSASADLSSNSAVDIGKNSVGYFNGLIDDVRIYDYALTSRQIAFEYNGGKPMGYWKFNEGQGNAVYDSSDNGNSGEVVIGTGGSQTATSSAWINGQVGKVGKALRFDGTDDYVEIGADNAIDVNNKSEYSVSAWIKPVSDGESYGIIYKKGSTMFRVQDDSNSLLHLYGNIDLATTDAVASSTLGFSANSWYQVVMTYASSSDVRKVKLYIDGKPMGKATDTAGAGNPTDDSASAAYIGGNAGANSFDGMIDEVRIYVYELLPSEVRKEYNSGYGVYFK